MIARECISQFLSALAAVWQTVDSSVSIIHFGSSLQKVDDKIVDIDVLLLSNRVGFDSFFSTKLARFKDELLSGNGLSGFDNPQRAFEEETSLFLSRQQILTDCKVMAKFMFGPFKYEIPDATKRNIFIHIKGPLFPAQFAEFCTLFPFHACSILNNNAVIHGKFEKYTYEDKININRKELNEFNRGLLLRMANSSHIFEVKKCLKKIVLNFIVYFQYLADQKATVFGQYINEFKLITELTELDDCKALCLKIIDFGNSLIEQRELLNVQQ